MKEFNITGEEGNITEDLTYLRFRPFSYFIKWFKWKLRRELNE